MDLHKIRTIYFCGIGGIGISAAARILRQMGKTVLGSDMTESEITQDLEHEGIEVKIPQMKDNIVAGIDLMVYSVAVPESNPERQQARQLGIPTITYPQLLGLLTQAKYGIGISGTDGKTTTTAMTGLIFIKAEQDPNILIGAKVKYLQSNARVGQSDYFIFESDEYQRAFLNYSPQVAVITNIREDHLDCYTDLADIKQTFRQYLSQVPPTGYVVVNADDANSCEVVKDLQAQLVTYGLEHPADVQAVNVRLDQQQQSYDLHYLGQSLGRVNLKVPARYNIYNSLAAAAVALTLKIDFKTIQTALSDFDGVWRRLERLGLYQGKEILTDYAHTPAAVRQTVQAMTDFYPQKKILFIFQPHQLNRTKQLFNQFVAELQGLKHVMLTDVFYVAGREKPEDYAVSAKKLAQAAQLKYVGDLEQTKAALPELVSSYDAVVLLGAGNIYTLAKELVNKKEPHRE